MTRQKPKTDGEWAKVGSKHYRHISGAEVKFDHNNWGWRINDGHEVWKTLSHAQYQVERDCLPICIENRNLSRAW